jgi:hypothetical protein
MTVENPEPKPQKDMESLAVEHKAAKDRMEGEAEKRKRETLKDLIRKQVLHTLGEPVGLLRVQVRPLWDKNYRVNVFVGVNVACARVVHSYFVVTDGDGKVLDATPKVQKQYSAQ